MTLLDILIGILLFALGWITYDVIDELTRR